MAENMIKPKDWADSHGIKVDVVMKLLRDAGVPVRTHMSKLNAKDYEQLEIAAEVERQKEDARKEKLINSTETDSVINNRLTRIKSIIARIKNLRDGNNNVNTVATESTSAVNIVEETKSQEQNANGKDLKKIAMSDRSKIKEHSTTSQPVLNASQRKELGDKILGIIANASPIGTWCTLANVGTILNENGIFYRDYGFEKLNQFLNEFADFFDFRQTPSPKEGAPAIPELRVKTTVAENELSQNSGSCSAALSSNTDANCCNADFQSQNQKISQAVVEDYVRPNFKENIETKESAANFLFGKKGDATDKLKLFALFPSSNNGGFFGNMEKLSQTALEETWSFGDDSNHKYPILTSYFKYTFERLVYEDEKNKKNLNWKTKLRVSSNGKYALFNTGLVDRYFEPIFALFTKTDRSKKPGITSEWVFKDFPNSKNNTMGIVYQYFGNDKELPEPANYLEKNNNSELIYNLNFSISKSNNWEHIISDNCGRLPLELLKNSGLSFDFNRFKDSSVNRELLHEELVDALKNSPESCRKIKSAIEYATGLALKRVRWNFKTAIPIYYPRTRKICLLLPLCLCDEKKADAALVLDPVNETYIQRTILTLKMAYIDARLITRPDSDWLETSKIDPTQEEN